MGVAEFVFGLITNLISSFIYSGHEDLDFFKRRKIKQRVDDATAAIVEPLIPFLSQENISEDKQRRLIETCVEELRPITQTPELLFQGSLNGQKIFDDLYANRELPQVVIEDGLKDVYTLICPRIATLICKVPEAVKDWESEAWAESYRRFDELIDQLKVLFDAVDGLSTASTREADSVLTRVRQVLAQKIRLELDLTGLRADRPVEGKFDDFFVHPQIKENIDEDKINKQPKILDEPDEIFELFTKSRHRTFLVGQPGAGKSTWSKWLQREALSQRWNGICIRVELRSFLNKGLPSLHQLIRENAGQHLAEELTGERIGEWIRSKKIVFILDGFDEIRPSDRDETYDWIINLHITLQECPVILTSRPLTTDHLQQLSSSCQGWIVEPFDENRIVNYIQRWYKHTPLLADGTRQVDAENLASQWAGDPTIGPLTGNPLLLSTLLMVHHLDGSLPNGRSQLYKRYVEGMLGLWDDRREVLARKLELTLGEKLQVMREFALKMFLQEKEQLDESAALEFIHEILKKSNKSLSAEEVLEGLRERSGLIIGPGIYSYIHKSVAEYLVAESVFQGDQQDINGHRIDRLCLFEHREDDRWNTVIFLWAGLAPIADVESFMKQCAGVECFSLAYGILNDQYDRFSAEIRCKMLLETNKPIRVPEIREKVWGYSHPVSMETDLRIPFFFIRNISAYFKDSMILFDKAIVDGTLSWSKHSSFVEGSLRDLLWMLTIRNDFGIESWKACLKSHCPNTAPSINWYSWATEYALDYFICEKDVEKAKIIINIFSDICKNNLIPILLLISIGYNFVYETNQIEIISNINSESIESRNIFSLKPLEVVIQTLSEILIFPKTTDKQDGEWLIGTKEWVNRSIFHDFESSDLLLMFYESIKDLVNKGLLLEDEAYKRTSNLVLNLLTRREELEADATRLNQNS